MNSAVRRRLDYLFLKRFRPRVLGLCAKKMLPIEAKMRVRVRVSFVRARVAQFVLFFLFFLFANNAKTLYV